MSPAGRRVPRVSSEVERRCLRRCGSLKESESDNLIHVSEITSTEAARSFADLLDAVEHRHEAFTIVRRGKAVARLEPVTEGRGADVKDVLHRHARDRGWAEDLAELRSLLEL